MPAIPIPITNVGYVGGWNNFSIPLQVTPTVSLWSVSKRMEDSETGLKGLPISTSWNPAIQGTTSKSETTQLLRRSVVTSGSATESVVLGRLSKSSAFEPDGELSSVVITIPPTPASPDSPASPASLTSSSQTPSTTSPADATSSRKIPDIPVTSSKLNAPTTATATFSTITLPSFEHHVSSVTITSSAVNTSTDIIPSPTSQTSQTSQTSDSTTPSKPSNTITPLNSNSRSSFISPIPLTIPTTEAPAPTPTPPLSSTIHNPSRSAVETSVIKSSPIPWNPAVTTTTTTTTTTNASPTATSTVAESSKISSKVVSFTKSKTNGYFISEIEIETETETKKPVPTVTYTGETGDGNPWMPLQTPDAAPALVKTEKHKSLLGGLLGAILKPVVDGVVRPVVEGVVKPVVDGVVKPVVDGVVRPVNSILGPVVPIIPSDISTTGLTISATSTISTISTISTSSTSSTISASPTTSIQPSTPEPPSSSITSTIKTSPALPTTSQPLIIPLPPLIGNLPIISAIIPPVTSLLGEIKASITKIIPIPDVIVSISIPPSTTPVVASSSVKATDMPSVTLKPTTTEDITKASSSTIKQTETNVASTTTTTTTTQPTTSPLPSPSTTILLPTTTLPPSIPTKLANAAAATILPQPLPSPLLLTTPSLTTSLSLSITSLTQSDGKISTHKTEVPVVKTTNRVITSWVLVTPMPTVVEEPRVTVEVVEKHGRGGKTGLVVGIAVGVLVVAVVVGILGWGVCRRRRRGRGMKEMAEKGGMVHRNNGDGGYVSAQEEVSGGFQATEARNGGEQDDGNKEDRVVKTTDILNIQNTPVGMMSRGGYEHVIPPISTGSPFEVRGFSEAGTRSSRFSSESSWQSSVSGSNDELEEISSMNHQESWNYHIPHPSSSVRQTLQQTFQRARTLPNVITPYNTAGNTSSTGSFISTSTTSPISPSPSIPSTSSSSLNFPLRNPFATPIPPYSSSSLNLPLHNPFATPISHLSQSSLHPPFRTPAISTEYLPHYSGSTNSLSQVTTTNSSEPHEDCFTETYTNPFEVFEAFEPFTPPNPIHTNHKPPLPSRTTSPLQNPQPIDNEMVTRPSTAVSLSSTDTFQTASIGHGRLRKTGTSVSLSSSGTFRTAGASVYGV